MGTNYYLHRTGKSCPTCGHDPINPQLHIGKSSYGWVFLWRGWRATDADGPGVDLDGPTSWAGYLRDQGEMGAEIYDEYHRQITVAVFLEWVEAKRRPMADGSAARRNSDPQWGSTAVAVDGDDVLYGEFC